MKRGDSVDLVAVSVEGEHLRRFNPPLALFPGKGLDQVLAALLAIRILDPSLPLLGIIVTDLVANRLLEPLQGGFAHAWEGRVQKLVDRFRDDLQELILVTVDGDLLSLGMFLTTHRRPSLAHWFAEWSRPGIRTAD
jgi:hypothetical protein